MGRAGWRTIAALTLLAGVGAAGRAVSRSPDSKKIAPARATGGSRRGVPVRAAPVRFEGYARQLEGEGRTEPIRKVTLRVEGGGTVLEAPVREGSRVVEGQLLLRLDTLRAALRVTAARAELERARLEYRALTLDDGELGLDSTRLARRRRNARIRSGTDRAEAELALAEVEREDRELRAPIAGRLTGVAVGPGARLRPGDSVGAILDLSRIVIEAEMLEEDLPELAVGAPVRATLLARPEAPIRGRVAAVSPLVERPAGRVRVRAVMEAPGGGLPAGAYATVSVAGRRHPPGLLVPAAAVVQRGQRTAIFLFRRDGPGRPTGRAVWVYVDVLWEDGDLAAIRPAEPTPELGEGAPVLVEGHELLAHEAVVELMEGSSPGSDH